MIEERVAQSTERFSRKREAILDAAIPLMNHRGVKGLTLGLAAAAVGLSTTSVTYYFKRKDDLAAAVLMRGIDWLVEMATRAVAEPTPEARLHRLLDIYLERQRRIALCAAPPLPILADIRALNEPQRTEVIGAYLMLFRTLRGLFETPELSWMDRAGRNARTHLLFEQLFWAPAWLHRYDPEDYPRVRERMFSILTEGFAAEGRTWTPQPPPMREITGEDGLDGREIFLLAATRLINSHGYRGASVDRISAELNVTKGSFYHHNVAKDDLVVSCFERTFEVMRKVQRLAQAGPGDPWDKLCAAAAALAEYQLSDHGPLLRTVALSALPEPIRDEMRQHVSRVSDRFAAMISDGIGEGALRPIDPFIAAQMLNATLNAGAELHFWVSGVTQAQAPEIFVRPLMMGVFRP